MNLYRHYNKPQALAHYDTVISTVKQKELDEFWKSLGMYFAVGTEGIDLVLSKPRISYLYAKHIANGRFPEGEDIIATDSDYSKLYALNILEGRFPKGEDAIAKDMQNSMAYARLIGGRFEKGEPAIARSALHSWLYGAKIMKQRFPLGEVAMRGTGHWKKYVKNMNDMGIEIE